METPYVYVHYEQLTKNIETMAQRALECGVNLKPHFKSHKTLEIAQLQIKNGAIGITTATLKETEVLLKNGIDNITLAHPLIGIDKINHYKKLMNLGKLTTIVLNETHGAQLNPYFTEKSPLEVWLKIDTGLHRLGIAPSEIPDTLKKLEKFKNIRVIGLLTHGGHSYQGKEPLETVGYHEGKALTDYRVSGLSVSCGSTPTGKYVMKVPGVDEVRPGNYVFYDLTMVSLGVAEIKDCALKVRATVIGCYSDHLIIDCGSKTLALDQGVHGNKGIIGYGYIEENPNLKITQLSEEHGFVRGSGIEEFHLGDQINIIPNHACPVVNLSDQLYIEKNGKITGNFQVIGRGH